jgi:hypothetical protein
MKIFKIILLGLLVINFSKSNSQALSQVCLSVNYLPGPGNGSYPLGIFKDSVNNNVYLYGFGYGNASPLEHGVKANYNTACFDNVSFFDSIYCEIYGMIRYQGDLWVGGNSTIYPTNGVGNSYRAKLMRISASGTTIIPVDNFGTIYGLKELNGELYVFGDFDSIAGIPTNYIAKYNGINWIAFPPINDPNGKVLGVEMFQGELYISGSILLPGFGFNNFGKLNGNAWQGVAGGIPGSSSAAGPMVVFNNKLVIGGSFHSSYGNVGNMVMQWDGTSWSTLGSGFDGPGLAGPRQLKVINGELWAAGNFVKGTSISNIAKWNGTAWNGMNIYMQPTLLGDDIFGFEQIGNEVICVGGFKKVNGDSTLGKVFKITIPVGLNEESKSNITIAPNPATDEVELSNLQIEKESFINIIDVSRRFISSTQLQPTSSNRYKLNISNLSQGCYMIEVYSNGKVLRQKFVKL